MQRKTKIKCKRLPRRYFQVNIIDCMLDCRPNDDTFFSWKYWSEMANVIPEKRLLLWDALYGALKKYYSTLQGRQKWVFLYFLFRQIQYFAWALVDVRFRLITENDGLRSQNEELRVLLHQYVTSDVNKELQIPPSKVLNIDS